MEAYKISVIVPVYNVEKYLERCLNSILQNTYQNLEIICVNDGSTDKSLDLLREFAKLDDRIILLDQPNGGISVARNSGLEIATGEYISFVDADDWVHKDFFRIMMGAIGDADIVHCGSIRCDCILPDQEITSITKRVICASDEPLAPLLKGECWKMIYKRSVIDAIRFPLGVKMCEDKVFTLQVLCKAKSVTKIDHDLYYHYINKNSTVFVHGLDIFPAAQEMLKLAKDTNNSMLLYDAYTAFLAHRYLNMFDVDSKRICKSCNQQLRKCRNLAKYIMPLKERVKLNLMAQLPIVYRLYRIVTDPTMLDWERKQRRKKHQM